MPRVASDGTDFLVVWQDDRRGEGKDIFATRVKADGTVLDPLGIVVASSPADERLPVAAWTGTHYLVVWEQREDATATSDLYGARISATGEVLDAAALPLVVKLRGQTRPALAAAGGAVLLAWQDAEGAVSRIRWSLIHPNGTAVTPEGSALPAPATKGQFAPALAANAQGFFLVWRETPSLAQQEIQGIRISLATGELIDQAGIGLGAVSGGDIIQPRVASNGAGFLVVWQDLAEKTFTAKAASVSEAGLVLDVPAKLLDGDAHMKIDPDVASHGSEYLVVWSDYRSGPHARIHATRLGTSAEGLIHLSDSGPFPLSDLPVNTAFPSVASGGGRYLTAWFHQADDGSDVHAVPVNASADAAARSPEAISLEELAAEAGSE